MESLFYHDSHEKRYRSPAGALSCGTLLKLALQASEPEQIRSVDLRLWIEGQGEVRLAMCERETGFYQLDFSVPETPGLFWYYFEINYSDGIQYYGNNAENLGGVGQVYPSPPPGYQVTVYKPLTIPDWYRQGIVYQIFLDRYCRTELKPGQYHSGALLHAVWEDDPCYVRDQATGRVLAYDFFGGNLAGLSAKLPVLKQLGVTVLYLNPIFESVSNHKYDTSDYHTIDPAFGSNEDFVQLCSAAREQGIYVILDGVFSHTGSDSIYFNRHQRYPSLGAYESIESPYYSWYRFKRYPNEYECWWGIDTLPNVNELDPAYQEFMVTGDQSVVKQWLKLGAKGWRLDVVDELPEPFVKALFQAVQETDPEAVVLGEVWEDASNKQSYGEFRSYLLGQSLHSTMNYPFRSLVLDFLLGHQSAQAIHRRFQQLQENYPKSHFFSALNLLGSHDVPRLLTVLGESPDLATDEEKRNFRLTGLARVKAVERLKMAVLWQMTFPGVPCIYYGDEAGLEGYGDPLNRRPYPWGQEDQEIKAWFNQIIRLRQDNPLFIDGEWRSLALLPDVYAYQRYLADKEAWVLLNRSDSEQAVEIPAGAGRFYDLLYKQPIQHLDGGKLLAQLPPRTGTVIMSQLRSRQAGVLLPIFSLPGPHGIGGLGAEARQFLAWLKQAGQTVWQVLPLQPAGPGNSPYQSPSAFAGNPLLIDLTSLAQQLNCPEVLNPCPEFPPGRVDYKQVKAYKQQVLQRCYAVFKQQKRPTDYQAFQERNAYWLQTYCAFQALKILTGNQPWSEWKGSAKEGRIDAQLWRHPGLIEQVGYEEFLQYVFERQWLDLKQQAEALDIKLVGDMPFYVDYESADVWRHQDYFDLNAKGKPRRVGGVPPDYFSAEGQLWGNPLYRFDKMKRDGWRWWIERIRHLTRYFHTVRIDHFRGFEAVWAVDAGAVNAVDGQWLKVPGEQIFAALAQQIGSCQLIAENLGVITPEVERLRQAAGCPGMKVLQFCSDSLKDCACDFDTVFYTGTHDNDTLQGWLKESNISDKSVWSWVEWVYASPADTVIVPWQDLLNLDSAYRTNRPGTAQENWECRITPDLWHQLQDQELLKKLFHLSKKYGFIAGKIKTRG